MIQKFEQGSSEVTPLCSVVSVALTHSDGSRAGGSGWPYSHAGGLSAGLLAGASLSTWPLSPDGQPRLLYQVAQDSKRIKAAAAMSHKA